MPWSGMSQMPTVQKYIQTQEEHHSKLCIEDDVRLSDQIRAVPFEMIRPPVLARIE